MKYLFVVLGIVLIFEGLPWFVSPRRVRSALAQLSQLPEHQLRVFGLACMMAGLLVVFVARG